MRLRVDLHWNSICPVRLKFSKPPSLIFFFLFDSTEMFLFFFKYSIYHSEAIFQCFFRFRCHSFRRLLKQLPDIKTFVYLNFAVSKSSLSSYIALFANNHMSYHSRWYFFFLFSIIKLASSCNFFLHLRWPQRHLFMLLILCLPWLDFSSYQNFIAMLVK